MFTGSTSSCRTQMIFSESFPDYLVKIEFIRFTETSVRTIFQAVNASILEIFVKGWMVLCHSRTAFARMMRLRLSSLALECGSSTAPSRPQDSLTGKDCWVMGLLRGAVCLKQLNQGCLSVSTCYHTSQGLGADKKQLGSCLPVTS